MEISRFANPGLLWLLLLLLPMIAYYIWQWRRGGASIQISSTAGVAKAPRTLRWYLRHVPFVLRCAAVALLVVAIARPQSVESGSNSKTEGIDIVLALDISGSMLARDFDPDRIGAAKAVAANFINARHGDRIGLVIFAGESFTQCPLTTDKRALLNLLSQVRTGMIEDGTAIGNGLATSVNRLRESEAKSKVVILLTDGVNNRGQITPVTAAETAVAYDIKVYTIGVGTRGKAPYPVVDMFGHPAGFQMMDVEIDEKMLTEIAGLTGGEYFRATDKNALQAVYDRINDMEKTEVEVTEYTRYNELFTVWLLWAVLLLAGEALFKYLFIRQIP
ncbi:MAG: VWA domain-containing protein [Rikenellaceae bacterium]|jgi:Ca-activated chloride channel family protein|nr:VWA domain-containing protein [Rikenellaceae bacterium]